MERLRARSLVRSSVGSRRRVIAYVLSLAGPAVFAGLLLPLRSDLQILTVAFGFLVLVVATAWLGRLGPAVVASVTSFLLFNYLFIPPYGTFAIRRAQDVVALFVFLGISILISLLFARAAERADAAEERERELRELQELSRDLVVHGPGEDTYRELLSHLTDRFGFAAGGLFIQEAGEGLVPRLTVGTSDRELTPSWDPAREGRAPERLPLSVGNRNLGLIVLVGERPALSAAESRVLRAVCDQLALVLERDRLLRAATDAEVFRQADGVRRGLLAAVSHDLRSPLAAIKASVTDLMDPQVERENEERLAVLRTIDQETDRLDALVANLLDMSRIEAGVLQAKIETVDLAERTLLAIDDAAIRWPEARFTPEIDERRTHALADPVFLDRVFANLLDNAARAVGEDGPPIEVRTHGQGPDVAVSVIDRGPGIAPAAREQLFYPFYRLEDRASHLGPGLGLAIAKGFLERMGGQIWVDDTPGGGTTISFSLPGAPA